MPMNEAYLRNLFENMVDGVLAAEVCTRRFRFANPAICKLTGYTADEMLSLGVESLHPPASLSTVVQKFKDLVDGTVSAVLDIPVRRKDGTVFFADINASSIVFNDETLLLGIFRDAWQRRKVEADLLHKTEELDRYFESSLDLLCIADTDGYFRRLNPEWENVLGYPISELVGIQFLSLVHPDDIESTKQAVASLSSQIKVLNFQNRYRHRDGSYRWIEWRSFPRDNWIYAAARDVTARKQAEASFFESALLFEAAFNASPNAISISRARDGRFVNVNPAACKMFGWTREEALTKSAVDVRLWVDDNERTAVIAELEASGRVDNTEVHLRRKDGSLLDASVSVRPLVLSGEKHLMFLSEDMSSKKRAEENLLKTQKLESLGLLAGGIAHDFNNLLSGIFGNIDLALGELATCNTAAATEYLERSMRVLEPARSLTRQLLTFSKGGAPVKKKGDLVRTVQDAVHFALTGASVKPVFEPVGTLWSCDFDVHQIGQVVENLIINAKQSMPGGGELFVRLRNVTVEQDSPTGLAAGPYICIEIEDFGIGIPDENRLKIFDPFFSTKHSAGGLGLTTGWSIIQRHGGHIDVQSEPGKGSTFFVYLPAAPEIAAEKGSNGSTANRGKGERILIMDDEPYIREVVEMMLSSVGYIAEAVRDGSEAQERMRTACREGRRFEVAILDLTIPGGMGGQETLPRIKRIDPEIRAVASSGYAEDPVMAAPQDFGFDAGLVKPYRRDDIVRILQDVLGKRSD